MTNVDAIATWIDATPQIRVVDITAAIADPATPAARRNGCVAAHHRISAHVRSRGGAG